jgi:hypothetical protein
MVANLLHELEDRINFPETTMTELKRIRCRQFDVYHYANRVDAVELVNSSAEIQKAYAHTMDVWHRIQVVLDLIPTDFTEEMLQSALARCTALLALLPDWQIK